MTITPENLIFDYDEEDDILCITMQGQNGRPAITYETDAGHLVRLDPETHEFLGAEILGFKANWEGRDIDLEWSIPERSGLLRRTKERSCHATLGARSLALN